MTDLELPAYMRALAEARRQYAEESSERLTEQAEAVEFLDTMAKLLGISVDAEDWWDMTISGKRAKIFGRIQILRGLRPTLETSPALDPGCGTLPNGDYVCNCGQCTFEAPEGFGEAKTAPPSTDLADYGYAPGNYTSHCLSCDQYIDFVDKRCRCCKSCAEKKRDKAFADVRVRSLPHDESQCWEPCGELGKSARHARVAPETSTPQPVPPESLWYCICGQSNFVTVFRCEKCDRRRRPNLNR